MLISVNNIIDGTNFLLRAAIQSKAVLFVFLLFIMKNMSFFEQSIKFMI